MSETMIPLLELLSKLLIYLGGAAIIGGFFSLLLLKEQPQLTRFIRRYISIGALLALCTVGVNFYAQVGNFAEAGWSGMVDPTYVAMLWASPIGQSVVLRIIALSLVFGLMLLVLLRSSGRLFALPDRYKNILVIGMVSLAGILFATSFNLIGHTAELNLISRLLLSLHVFIALLWMGSLLPLSRACQSMAVQPLRQLMHRFGLIAMGLVGVLLVCGFILAYRLIGSFSELISTSYGLMLLAKIILVDTILAFAAWHKLRLVPQLTDQLAARRLQRSILWEALVGLCILGVTVLLSTVVGPIGSSFFISRLT